jgi:NOL1/NOP2/fmu family ribosome biogenesis protein
MSLSVFDGFALLERRQAYWLLTDSPHLYKLRRLRVHRTGVPVLRKIQNRLKPTTAAVRLFGCRATRNVVDLDREHLMRLLQHGEIHLSPSVPPGYVIVTHHSQVLGCGLYTGQKLLNQIPRGYRPYP